MVIVYDSKTGNVERFVKKLKKYCPNLSCIPIEEYNYKLGPYHLITHTTKNGEVSENIKKLLYSGYESVNNLLNLQSISSSGNKNWGKNFGKAADIIIETIFRLGIKTPPIFLKFELSGTVHDVETYINKLKAYGK